ncbi:MAG: hypothetical protein LBK47_00400 [Prevotellaceae bacterium]|jgi:hypothetical protein|nr:hypothetical protein [Prevotellaceae bacterium]
MKKRSRVLLAIVAYNVFLKGWFHRKISELFHTLKEVLSTLEVGKAASLRHAPLLAISYYASRSIVKSKGAQIRMLRI